MKLLNSIKIGVLAVALAACNSPQADLTTEEQEARQEAKGQVSKEGHWPNGDRLVVSFSMQFETGGQPEGAESPFSGNPLPKGNPDMPAESWFRYGAKEGVYRMLDLWKKHDIHVTSHVVGEAAIKYPEVARAIAEGGHEIAAHGIAWSDQWDMSYEEEHAFIKEGIDTVEAITGQRGRGYNANWLRRGVNTLKVLQDLDFLYHIDDLSRDEPFVTEVRGKDFVVMPYTLRNNDIVNIEGKSWSPDQFLAQLKAEFHQLYLESGEKRRMMSVSLHDRIGGAPSVVHVVDEFIEYVKNYEGVSFMRKDKIAEMVLNDPNTPRDNSKETAYSLLRITMGVNLLAHGLVRFPKMSGFSDWMVDFFKDSIIPSAVVKIWATILPFLEFGIGLFLILGIFTYRISIAGALLIIVLLFGSCLTEQWEWAGMQMIYALIFSILISQIEYNKIAIGNLVKPK